MDLIKQISSRAMCALVQMRSSGQLCDGELKTEDGGRFRIHRSIMATCSPYFQCLYTTKLNKGEKYKAKIPGVSKEMLQLIIDYAYTRKTNVNEGNLEELLAAADQFDILGMVTDCFGFIMNDMDASNCIRIVRLSRAYAYSEMERKSHRYLMKNFREVVEQSQEFLELPIQDVIPILDHEELNVCREDVVWEAILKWIDYDKSKRRRYIAELLRCVRTGLLENGYFMEKVKNHIYVQNNEECKPIVIATLKCLYDLDISRGSGENPASYLVCPRIPHDIMFAIGGWSGGSATNAIEAYDTRADRWIMIAEVDPTGPRAYHKCVVIGLNIYVIGGFDGIEYFNSCRCFNASSKMWRELSPMHTRRCYVSAVLFDEHIYAIGGFDGHFRQNTAEKFDYRRNQWSFIASMNVQRSDACATALERFIYITGGFNGSDCLRSVEMYNPDVNQWTLVAPMASRRSGVSCISFQGCIFVLGGFNGMARLSTGEKYNPETSKWIPIQDMYSPRSNFAVEIMDDMIFAIGGFNGFTTINNVECYDAKQNEWYEATNMHAFRSALAACVVSTLPNIRDYISENRSQLLEEKRQKLQRAQQIQESSNIDLTSNT